MQVSNRVYDAGKWLVLIFLPASAVLLNGLGDLYQWEWASVSIGTVNVLTVFLGSLLQLSSFEYYNGDNKKEDDWNGPTYG